MSTSARWDHQTLALEVNGASLELDTLVSHGRKPPVLFLHGFGSTKEDYADFAQFPNLAAGGSSLSMRPASDVRRAAIFRASRLSFSSTSRTPC